MTDSELRQRLVVAHLAQIRNLDWVSIKSNAAEVLMVGLMLAHLNT